MDKLNPSFQDTPVTTQTAHLPSTWYGSESTVGEFTAAEVGWLHAQGWRTFTIVSSGGSTQYFMTRRVIKPESVLRDLVQSYTDAYNEGRQLNDQRYDDLLVLYTAILDKTEDEFNELETFFSGPFTALLGTLIGDYATDHTAWAADVEGDLDTLGTDLLAEINARFDAELSKAQNSLVDRGLYSATLWTTISAGVERERTRTLNQANDTIAQRQLELKHKVYGELASVTDRVIAAEERFWKLMEGQKDRQVAVRNLAAEALGRLVERREDGYPDLSEIGRLAAALGAGSPEAFAP